MAFERISINPARMSGLPCIRDTRVTVTAVLGQLAAGQTIEQILLDYPFLDREDVLAALEFAAVAMQERELPLGPTGVRLLVDANLSFRIAEGLSAAGYDATHVVDHGLFTATDEAIMQFAVSNLRAIISADSDFATMLALTGSATPSLLLLRSSDRLAPEAQCLLLTTNLPSIEGLLLDGAIVSLSRDHLRVRMLPIIKGT